VGTLKTSVGIWTPSRLVSQEHVERAKPQLEKALADGRTKVRIGLTRWTFRELDITGFRSDFLVSVIETRP
jgi:hypothetical protein